MREDPAKHVGPVPLRIGSLFSGYGGLDLAVEHVFRAQTIWFSEISPVQHVFAHHWPDAPNLGDITSIDWDQVPPVDILCGGFPCQDISTVGKMAGLAPGTRSGLWSHMADAIDHLRPEYVVIENVRGLLSASAARATPEGDSDATPDPATLRHLEPDLWGLGDEPARPLRALGAVMPTGWLCCEARRTHWMTWVIAVVGSHNASSGQDLLTCLVGAKASRRGSGRPGHQSLAVGTL